MSCNAVQRGAVQCHAMQCNAVQSCAVPCNSTQLHAAPRAPQHAPPTGRARSPTKRLRPRTRDPITCRSPAQPPGLQLPSNERTGRPCIHATIGRGVRQSEGGAELIAGRPRAARCVSGGAGAVVGGSRWPSGPPGWPGLCPGVRGAGPGARLKARARTWARGVQRALPSAGLGPLAAGGLQRTVPPGPGDSAQGSPGCGAAVFCPGALSGTRGRALLDTC